jgi:hypothetical protein
MKKDQIALVASIAFSVIFIYLIYFFGAKYIHADFLPDQGASWYYWKLPVATFWPRFTGWTFFILHLISIWYIAYLGSKAKKPFDDNISKYNYWMLGVNAFFIILHLVQTSIWYDTLAHDTPVWLSQYSVIVMLVLILIMVNGRQGLIFGKKLPIPANITNFVTKIHSYYIILALVFTFWYHPMEPSIGHFAGFFYMFMLFIQSSLMFTSIHTNKYWIFALQFLVLLHGTTVAVMQGNGMWPMFAFGFGFISVFTHIYILKLPKLATISLQIVYLLSVLFVYSGVSGVQRSFAKIYEISFIPVTEYALVIIFVLLISGGIWVKNLLSIKNISAVK